MALWLAPMEGLMDYSLRAIVSRFRHIDLAVSEFVRVVDSPLPDSVFLTQVPELSEGGLTGSGAPVRVQLLGSDPEALLANAHIALKLGSHGVDFNFGCPSKTVNRHCGGAALLKEPDRIYTILSHIQSGLPANTPLSAKMRLGYDDASQAVAIAQAVEAAGFNTLVVHGRTKVQGYKPPADWQAIGRIREAVTLNVIANGDVFTVEDYKRCQHESGCQDIMIGRGAVYQPNLFAQVADGQEPLSWQDLLGLIQDYLQIMKMHGFPERHIPGRIKQWLKLLCPVHPPAQAVFTKIKACQSLRQIENCLSVAAQSG